MPSQINDWPDYLVYLIKTEHPIAKKMIQDFNQLQHCPLNTVTTSIPEWRKDTIETLVAHNQRMLQRWSNMLMPIPKQRWQAFLQPYLQQPENVTLYRELNALLMTFDVYLKMNDYEYYINHHQVGVENYGKVMNKRAEKFYSKYKSLKQP